MTGNRPRKALRVSAACDHCHKRRIKCRDSGEDPARCQTCVDFDLLCTYHRPVKRGKSQLHDRLVSRQLATAQPSAASPQQVSPAPPSAGFSAPAGQGLSTPWRAFAQAATPLVYRLMAIYFQTAYPIFPFFDRTELNKRLSRMDHASSPSFFCSVMAACALASARVRDGAVVSRDKQSKDLFSIPADTFYAAAEDVIPRDLLQIQDFDFIRGCALLAIASIQEGKINAMHKYIGAYFTIVSIQQWHDEANWPPLLSPVEQEERRRLYWSIYTLDIYSSIVWDGCAHFQEAHARVEYPTGFEGLEPSDEPKRDPHWILGWNFTTDLYRILEHAVGKLRTRGSSFNFVEDEPQNLSIRGEEILHKVNSRYAMLPAQFREQSEATGDPDTDIYGFQAANIQATLALLQIVLFSLDGNSDLNKKCTVASNVLSTIRQVPTPFLRAISTPLIYHIAGIGIILGSVMEGQLSETSYQRVRDLLLSMASLLGTLEAFLHRSAGADRQLRALIDRIDEYMRTRQGGQQQVAAEPGVPDETPESTDNPVTQDLSPQFQLPDELLQDWTWPYDISQAYLPFGTGDLQ